MTILTVLVDPLARLVVAPALQDVRLLVVEPGTF
jgi:hypothetical protein